MEHLGHIERDCRSGHTDRECGTGVGCRDGESLFCEGHILREDEQGFVGPQGSIDEQEDPV